MKDFDLKIRSVLVDLGYLLPLTDAEIEKAWAECEANPPVIPPHLDNPLIYLGMATILTRMGNWEKCSLGQVASDLVENGYTVKVEFRKHDCESGQWIDIVLEKDGKTTGGIGGSRLDVARNRLVHAADRLGVRDFLRE